MSDDQHIAPGAILGDVTFAEVNLTDLGVTALETPLLYRDLTLLGAPAELRSGISAFRRGTSLGVDGVAELGGALGMFLQSGTWGDVISRSRITKPVPVVAAGSPLAAGSKSSGNFTFSQSVGGGLSLKIGGLGLGAKVTHTITDGLSVECVAGESKVAILLVPFDMVRQQYRPPGGHEWLHVVRYEPIKDEPIGRGAIASTSDQLLGYGTEKAVPLKADTSFSGSQQRDIEVEFSFDFSVDDDSLSLSATLSGTVSVGFEYDLPPGKFELFWLLGPAGACVVAS